MSWIATPDNIEGRLIGIIADPVRGTEIGYFETLGGHSFSVHLGVPLCPSCDTPEHDGHCTDCETVFVQTVQTGMGVCV